MGIKTVHIGMGKGYDVFIGSGLLRACGSLIGECLGPCLAAVITDSTVKELFLNAVTESLENAGFAVSTFAFPAGEKSKTLSTFADILEFLAGSRLTRGDCVIALGGGVVGDMAGFAAGCYLRGIRYVQMPTTFLSAVDSSVGGKTAVNLSAGKNLAGLFVRPEAVICDVDCLKLLPENVFADGAAEAIKTGVLSGEELFSILENGNVRASLPDIIEKCITFKGSIVEADEFESGCRRLLNLGHTVGHAVEKCSGFAVPHGHAVAEGIAVIARSADRLGYNQTPCAPRIERVLRRNGLPVTSTFSAEELAEAALSDKKRSGDGIVLVLPRRIGEACLKEIPYTELRGVIRAGLEE